MPWYPKLVTRTIDCYRFSRILARHEKSNRAAASCFFDLMFEVLKVTLGLSKETFTSGAECGVQRKHYKGLYDKLEGYFPDNCIIDRPVATLGFSNCDIEESTDFTTFPDDIANFKRTYDVSDEELRECRKVLSKLAYDRATERSAREHIIGSMGLDTDSTKSKNLDIIVYADSNLHVRTQDVTDENHAQLLKDIKESGGEIIVGRFKQAGKSGDNLVLKEKISQFGGHVKFAAVNKIDPSDQGVNLGKKDLCIAYTDPEAVFYKEAAAQACKECKYFVMRGARLSGVEDYDVIVYAPKKSLTVGGEMSDLICRKVTDETYEQEVADIESKGGKVFGRSVKGDDGKTALGVSGEYFDSIKDAEKDKKITKIECMVLKIRGESKMLKSVHFNDGTRRFYRASPHSYQDVSKLYNKDAKFQEAIDSNDQLKSKFPSTLPGFHKKMEMLKHSIRSGSADMAAVEASLKLCTRSDLDDKYYELCDKGEFDSSNPDHCTMLYKLLLKDVVGEEIGGHACSKLMESEHSFNEHEESDFKRACDRELSTQNNEQKKLEEMFDNSKGAGNKVILLWDEGMEEPGIEFELEGVDKSKGIKPSPTPGQGNDTPPGPVLH